MSLFSLRKVGYLVIFIGLYFCFYKLPFMWTEMLFSEKATELRHDSLSVLFFLCAFFCLAAVTNRVGLAVASLLGTVFCSAVIASSWLYFDFYKDFITLSSLALVPDMIGGSASEGLSSLKSFSFFCLLLVCTLFTLLAMCFVLFRECKSDGEVLGLKVLSVLFIALAVFYSGKFYVSNAGVIAHNSPPLKVNPVGYFFRGFADLFQVVNVEERHRDAAKNLRFGGANKDYPLLNTDLSSESLRDEKQLNVIIVVLESVRAAESEFFSKSELRGVTPNLDRIARLSDSFMNHYSNSVQTIRAETSMLCGVLDLSKGSPASRRGMPVSTSCLPSILGKHGYETFWVHGNEMSFFNRDEFLPKLGIKHLLDGPKIRQDNPEAKELGWGVSDQDMFKHAIEFLSVQNRPFFAELLTLSNHFPFDHDFEPVEQESDSYSRVYNNYLRGARYTDTQLGMFWDLFQKSRLKDNTLVIITSDHGLWFDDESLGDKYAANEALFRVPMLIWSPGVNKAASVMNTVSSHVDIAPTILSILGLSSGGDSFLGEDLYKQSRRELALMTGFGSFSARNRQQFCYSSGETQGSGYYNNTLTEQSSGVYCLPALESPLDPTGERHKPKVNVEMPSPHYRNLIELNDISWMKGFIPEAKFEG